MSKQKKWQWQKKKKKRSAATNTGICGIQTRLLEKYVWTELSSWAALFLLVEICRIPLDVWIQYGIINFVPVFYAGVAEWQTHLTQNQAGNTVWVQVPPPAP